MRVIGTGKDETVVLHMRTDSAGTTGVVRSDDDMRVAGPNDCYQGIFPSSTDLCVIIKPIPEGYRLATDEDLKDKHNLIKGRQYLSHGNEWKEGTGATLSSDQVYIVPKQSDSDIKRKALQDKLANIEKQMATLMKQAKEVIAEIGNP